MKVMTEVRGLSGFLPSGLSKIPSMSALSSVCSSPSSLFRVPAALITSQSPSKFLGGSPPEWGASSDSLLRLQSGKITTRRVEGASHSFDFRRASSMKLPTWWWLWRGRGALVRGGSTLQGVSQGRERLNRSNKELYCALLSKEDLNSNTGRTKLFTCHGAPKSRGRQNQASSSEDEFAWPARRTLQAVRQWNWSGFRRSISQEVRRKREDDEGDWRYSPEWWGTQAGGWGHNEGETIFEAPSVMGNGFVSVTAHPASIPRHLEQESGRDSQGFLGGAFYRVLGYEWRVLRFNNVTRQSVAKVKALATSLGDVILLQEPNCVAFEYIKSMISAGLSAVSFSGLDLQRVHKGYQKMRILCIGLGGGSLPLFLAHNLPGATVEVVEIDAAVISAAVETMGFPPSYASTVNSADIGGVMKDKAVLWGDMLERIIVLEKDGDAFVQDQARNMSAKKALFQYDLVFVDAYDGEDVVPFQLWDRSGPFLHSLSCLLHADHGTVVVNLHTDSAPPSILERISGKFGPGFDPKLPQGKRVQEAALAYRDVLLQEVDHGDRGYDINSNLRGLAFTVAVSLQGNVCLVVSKGASMPETCSTLSGQREETVIQKIVDEAERIQNNLNISFDLSKRVLRGFQIVK